MTHPAFATYNKPELEKAISYLEGRIRACKFHGFTAWMKEHFESELKCVKMLLAGM